MYYGLATTQPARLYAGVRIGTARRSGLGFWQSRDRLQAIAQVAILQWRWQSLVDHGGPALKRAFGAILRAETELLRSMTAS